MKAYLAARYSRRLELSEYRAQLEANGIQVTSRWLNGEHEEADENPGSLAGQFAADDVADILAADTFITFTEAPRTGATRGGRHVEFGIALAFTRRSARLGIFRPYRLVVVGHRENVFHHLPEVEFYETWDAARGALLSASVTA